MIAEATGTKPLRRRIPLWLTHVLAAGYEVYARATGRPVLLSWAMARTVATENDRSRYDPAKSERELGLRFRPAEETLRDEVAWLRAKGLIPGQASKAGRRGPTPQGYRALHTHGRQRSRNGQTAPSRRPG